MAKDHYGARSLTRLKTTHPLLQRLMRRVGEHFPNTVLEGMRDIEAQRKNVARGVSKTMNSKHLIGEAVDCAPDPLSWPRAKRLMRRIEGVTEGLTPDQKTEMMYLVTTYTKEVSRWYYFGGFVLGTAEELGIGVRWGGDWDSDRKLTDQSFDDLPHFELLARVISEQE